MRPASAADVTPLTIKLPFQSSRNRSRKSQLAPARLALRSKVLSPVSGLKLIGSGTPFHKVANDQWG